MYAHQVIDDLKKAEANLIEKGIEESQRKMIGWVVENISRAQKFHLGNFDEMDKCYGESFRGKRLFCDDELSQDIRLPYKTCWFDYYISGRDSGYSTHKGGMLVTEFKPDIFKVRILYYIKEKGLFHKQTDVESPAWDISDYVYMVVVGDSLYNKRIDNANNDGTNLNVYYAYKSEDIKEIDEAMLAVNNTYLCVLNMALCLLSCKNITTKTRKPPAKKLKKGYRVKKTPLFEYYTLALKPTTKQQKSEPQGLYHNRLHLCRGHFKTYTAENPLFGQLTGRYWWQPMVRGKNKDGVIMKDYAMQHN